MSTNEHGPKIEVPAGACDTHVHVFDPDAPTAPTANAPGPGWATVDAFQALCATLGTSRSVIVQPTAYGSDNTVTLHGLAALGDSARGVAILDRSMDDAALARMTTAGVRAARFQMFPGGLMTWEDLEPIAARVTPLGWHIQLQMDGRHLHEHETVLQRLPCTLVIDHVGKFIEPVTPDHPGFQALLRLLANGRTWLKLSAPYETSKVGPPLYDDVGELAKAAVAAAPHRMVWASNWPHVSVSDLPDDVTLLDLLEDWVPDPAERRAVLVDNPATLYGFPTG